MVEAPPSTALVVVQAQLVLQFLVIPLDHPAQFRDSRELGLDRMVFQPFRGDAGRYPLGYREIEK